MVTNSETTLIKCFKHPIQRKWNQRITEGFARFVDLSLPPALIAAVGGLTLGLGSCPSVNLSKPSP